MDTLGFRKRKLNGATGETRGYLVEEDEFGRWLFVPKGSLWVGTYADGTTATSEVGQGSAAEGCGVLFLLNESAMYLPQWWTKGHWPWDFTVDICCEQRLIDGVWEWTDLEVDLFLLNTGVHGVEDFDEFVDACHAGLIDAPTRDAAIDATATVERLIRNRAEPYSQGWDVFDRAQRLGLSPV